MRGQIFQKIKGAHFVLSVFLWFLFFSSPGFAAENDEQLIFTADEVTVLKEERVVTARGRVKFSHKDYHLEADIVTFNELTGEVWASGNVKLTDPRGNAAGAARRKSWRPHPLSRVRMPPRGLPEVDERQGADSRRRLGRRNELRW